jgi:hypothetical protein
MVDSPGIFTLCTSDLWRKGWFFPGGCLVSTKNAGTSPIAMRMSPAQRCLNMGYLEFMAFLNAPGAPGTMGTFQLNDRFETCTDVHMFEQPQIHVIQLQTVHARTTDTSCGKFDGGKNNSGLVCL